MIKVSVIIPVYKVELTLRQCVDSVINQSFKDLEIILIDDGSPDKCGDICEEYAKKDNRVRVIHKKNEGLAKARNDGIKIASGEWILFVDSDDWLQVDYIQKLYIPDLDKTSISICGANAEYRVGHWKKRFGIQGSDEITDDEMLKVIQANASAVKYNPINNGIKIDLIPPPWNKLYNRLLILEKGIYFDEHLEVMEDFCFNLRYFAWVKRIIAVNSFGYNYRYNGGGITKKFDERRLEKDSAFFANVCKFTKQSSNKYLHEFIYSAICQQFIINLYRYYFAPNNPYGLKEKIEILRVTLGEEKHQEAFEKVNRDTLSHWQGIVIQQARKKRAVAIMILHYLNRIRKTIKGCQ